MMVGNYKLRAGLIFLLAVMIPAVARPQIPTGPLGEPTGALVLQSGGTNVFGSGWGTGTLTFQGQTFKFSADGIQPVTPSESTDLAEGKVYNLYSINDFSGFYSSIEGSSQPDSQYLQNEHYVVVHITKSKKGVIFRTMDKPVRVELTN
jgi:hypothetical protein